MQLGGGVGRRAWRFGTGPPLPAQGRRAGGSRCPALLTPLPAERGPSPCSWQGPTSGHLPGGPGCQASSPCRGGTAPEVDLDAAGTGLGQDSALSQRPLRENPGLSSRCGRPLASPVLYVCPAVQRLPESARSTQTPPDAREALLSPCIAKKTQGTGPYGLTRPHPRLQTSPAWDLLLPLSATAG